MFFTNDTMTGHSASQAERQHAVEIPEDITFGGTAPQASRFQRMLPHIFYVVTSR